MFSDTKAALTVQQILTLTNVGGQLLTAGLATAITIRQAIKAMSPGLSDADLNAIVQGAREDARRRMALADAEIEAAQAAIAARTGPV